MRVKITMGGSGGDPFSVGEKFNPLSTTYIRYCDTISLGRSSENVNTKQLLFLISPMDPWRRQTQAEGPNIKE